MRSRLRPRLLLWLAAPSLLVCLSCSPEKTQQTLNPVTGKVLFQDKPLKGCTVALRRKGTEDLEFIPPMGTTDEAGEFTLKTGEAIGAPEGEYVVVLVASEEIKPPAGSMAMGFTLEDRFKGAYADKSKSKFPVVVKAGANQLEPFHLK